MEWLWDRPALVGGHVGRLPSGRWVLELTECVCVCVFFMEERWRSGHHRRCLNWLTSAINRHKYLLRISTLRRRAPYKLWPTSSLDSSTLWTLQSKRSGFHRGPNWRCIGEACFLFFFSFLVPYCICVFFGTEPFGKYISIWATVALLTQISTQRAVQESNSWMQEEGVKDWAGATPQRCRRLLPWPDLSTKKQSRQRTVSNKVACFFLS